jgi:DNA polymerase-4
MHQAIDHDAAPMRIPFAHVPEIGLEEETSMRRRNPAHTQSIASVDELYLLRERQFKVMAENAHRESQKRRGRTPDDRNTPPFKAGAGGWSSAAKAEPEPEVGQTGSLF